MVGLHPVLALLRLLLSPGKGELCLCHLLRRLDPFPWPAVTGSVCQGERPWRLHVLQPPQAAVPSQELQILSLELHMPL